MIELVSVVSLFFPCFSLFLFLFLVPKRDEFHRDDALISIIS